MKTVILIISPASKAVEIEDIKDKIIKYLGSRTVEQVPDDVPGLILNQTLDIIDKTVVSNIVCNSDDRSVVLFMETDKDTLPNDNYYVFEILKRYILRRISGGQIYIIHFRNSPYTPIIQERSINKKLGLVVPKGNRYNSQSADCDFAYIRSKNNIVTYQFNKKLFACPKC